MVPFYRDPYFLGEGFDVAHGFFGRRGGVSVGVYESLNCRLDGKDNPVHVAENRERIRKELGALRMISQKQVHGNVCHIVNIPWRDEDRPTGDAMVTDRPGVALAVLTADCGPVLFAGKRAHGETVIGAAHAGWRGAVAGVLESTVETMVKVGVMRESIRASVGPCIAQKSYEVGEDMIAEVIKAGAEDERFFMAGRTEGKCLFDLPGYCAARLGRAGVGRVSITGIDTYTQEQDYFSNRRKTHRGEADYGLQISALVIRVG